MAPSGHLRLLQAIGLVAELAWEIPGFQEPLPAIPTQKVPQRGGASALSSEAFPGNCFLSPNSGQLLAQSLPTPHPPSRITPLVPVPHQLPQLLISPGDPQTTANENTDVETLFQFLLSS